MWASGQGHKKVGRHMKFTLVLGLKKYAESARSLRIFTNSPAVKDRLTFPLTQKKWG